MVIIGKELETGLIDSHFVRGDELEEKKVKPLPYYRGSRGPAEADVLRDKYGYRRSTDYEWVEPQLSSHL